MKDTQNNEDNKVQLQYRVIASFSIGLLATPLLSIFIALEPIFILSDEQLLNAFSSLAQLIGGLYGLYMTAYSFFLERMDSKIHTLQQSGNAQEKTTSESVKSDIISESNDHSVDALCAIRRNTFHGLVSITIFCFLTIIFCIMGIVSLKFNFQYASFPVFDTIVNTSFILFGISLIYIFFQSLKNLDPDATDKEVRRQANIAKNTLDTSTDHHHENYDKAHQIDFKEFIRNYNTLHDLIITFAVAIIRSGSHKVDRRYFKPEIIQSLNVLCQAEIITRNQLGLIHAIRKYRNALVHGLDFDITPDIYYTLKHELEELEKKHQVFCDNQSISEPNHVL